VSLVTASVAANPTLLVNNNAMQAGITDSFRILHNNL